MNILVDERKSWRRLIVVYVGVVALIGAITFFVVRGASHGQVVILANGTSTPTPTVIDVYRGFQADAGTPHIHAKRAQKVALEPTPSPVPSPSPSSAATASPAAKPSPHVKPIAALPKHPVRAPQIEIAGVPESMPVADGPTIHTAHARHVALPVQIAQAAPAEQQADAPSSVTEAPAAPTAAPAAHEAAREDENVPIYAPERIVDAQVRVAAQPDFPDGARERGEHGTSIVLVTIDPKGNVVSAAVAASSGFPALDRAAIAAARASQFVAPKINGRPATETYRLVYDFSP